MGIYLKFGSKENTEDLLKNGTVYCNPISYFTNNEIKSDYDGRYDFDELVTKFEHTTKGLMWLSPVGSPEKIFKFNIQNMVYKEHISEPIGNLYCLFDYEPENYEKDKWYILDERLKAFGSHFLLIHNSLEFAERIRKALNELSIEFSSGKIEYKDFSKYSGKKNLFQKSLDYSYQKEVRMLLNTGLNIPFEFSIGNIEDIAQIFSSDHLKFMKAGDIKLNLQNKSSDIILRVIKH